MGVVGTGILASGFLSGCTAPNDEVVSASATSGDDTTQSAVSDTDADDSVLQQDVDTTYTSLKVTSACIGCGRCIRTDEEHFSFDSATQKAEVRSDENLGTSALDAAIRACPARAIVRS